MIKDIELHVENGKWFNYLICKNKNLDINIDELSILKSNYIENLLNINIMEQDGCPILSYDLISNKCLNSILGEFNSKDVLNSLVNALANTFYKVKNYGLNTENIVLNINNIYVDNNKNFLFVYIPAKNSSFSCISLKEFLKSIVFSKPYDINDDLEYFIKLFNFLNTKEDIKIEDLISFSNINKIEINSEENKSKIIIIDFKSADKQKGIDIKLVQFEENWQNEVNISTKKVEMEKVFNNELETTVLCEDYGIETMLLNGDNKVRAALFIKAENRTCYIDRDNFRIGRDGGQVHCILESKSVGRYHGEIIKRGNDYYYKDNYSKNGSYVNNERLIPNKEYKLQNNYVIKLAKEEIIFKNE